MYVKVTYQDKEKIYHSVSDVKIRDGTLYITYTKENYYGMRCKDVDRYPAKEI